MLEKCERIKEVIDHDGWAKRTSDISCKELLGHLGVKSNECWFEAETNPYPDVNGTVKFTCGEKDIRVDVGITYDTWATEQSEHKISKIDRVSSYLDQELFDHTIEENEVLGDDGIEDITEYNYYLYGTMQQKYKNIPTRAQDEVISKEVKRALDFMTESINDVVLSGKYS